MVRYKCYKANELINLLGNDFHIIDEKVQDSFSDWVAGDINTEYVNKFYITNMNDIKEIVEWHGLWSELVVKLIDETELKLHSNDINSQDKSFLRIIENNFISPSFERQENYILVNKDLDKWLLFNGISQDSLDNITIVFELYPTYIYKDIHEPIIKDDKICGHYGQFMELSEDKIDKALADIKDVEMRLKIERVMKSFPETYQ